MTYFQEILLKLEVVWMW